MTVPTKGSLTCIHLPNRKLLQYIHLRHKLKINSARSRLFSVINYSRPQLIEIWLDASVFLNSRLLSSRSELSPCGDQKTTIIVNSEKEPPNHRNYSS